MTQLRISSSIFGALALIAAVQLLVTERAQAAIAGLEQVAGGLSSPVFATHVPGDDNRLFVAEIGGAIKIVDLTTNTVTGTFLTIPGVDTGNSEGGLLGLAFHPEYSNQESDGFGKFYVYVTLDNTLPENVSPFSSHVREYQVNPNNPNQALTTPRDVLVFTQPQANHNGGWIGFGPNDGYLYIASGDGGNGYDVGNGHTTPPEAPGNAQDLTNNFLGKMLRIDVNVPPDDDPDDGIDPPAYLIPPSNPFVGEAGDDEIWAYGLRNPFRSSFDRVTGDLWIGDVGQTQREEIDFQPANSPGGENYGWRMREGKIQTDGGVGGPDSDAYTGPIYDYGRGSGDFLGETVIGGYAYRGPDPDLQGRYFFGDADSGNDNVWILDLPNPVGPVTTVDNINAELGELFNDRAPEFGRIGSFGEDNKGNLYLVDLFGAVYRIVTNNVIDGDYNADGDVDDDDYTVWKASLGSSMDLDADGNGDGIVDAADYTVWRDNLGDSVRNLAGGGGSVSVPEPAICVALIPLLALVLLRGRRRGTL
jgi:glucose/arabinose dehydrogenase